MSERTKAVQVTDDMMFAAAVGWNLAHEEVCRGASCSAHQPIDAAARQPHLLVALLAALLTRADPGLAVPARVEPSEEMAE